MYKVWVERIPTSTCKTSWIADFELSKFIELGSKISLTSRLWKSAIHFFPLVIEVFGSDMFFHDCANAIWNFKGSKGLLISVFFSFFFHQIFLIILQRMQASFILSQVVMVSLATSWLSPVQNASLITMASYNWLVVETKRFSHLVCVSFKSYKLILVIFLFPLYIFWICRCVY